MIPFRLFWNRLNTRLIRTKKSLIPLLLVAGREIIFSLTLYRIPIYCFIANLFGAMNCFFSRLDSLVNQDHGSNIFSSWLRPMFEHQRAQSVFGVGLIMALLFFGIASFVFPVASDKVFAGFPSGAEYHGEETVMVNPATDLVISTERRYQIPVELIGVSQGYHSYHPGVDMRAPFGSEIRPIAAGMVRDVLRSALGYGQAIIIDHEEEIASMYAHVGNIFVDVGSHVDQNTVIAEVGLTGTTTGPHLHLEIYQKGMVVNPQPFLGY